MFETPILFLVFNRPDTTAKVFERIREISPSRLYFAADGPRAGKTEEKELCDQVRQVVNRVDWPCQVKTLFRDTNLGCKTAVSGAINWFFDYEEEGIILEDDCYPSLSFFPFCKTMLDMYRDDDKIFHIAGNNFQEGQRRSSNSYYFSKYTHIWGWATWKRAWKFYELEMTSFPAWSGQPDLMDWFSSREEMNYWIKKFSKFHKHPLQMTTWDYQWLFTAWLQKGISIIPEVNLVKNLGIGSGTHTISTSNRFVIEPDELTIHSLMETQFQINHKADLFTFKNYMIYKGSLLERIINRIKKYL